MSVGTLPDVAPAYVPLRVPNNLNIEGCVQRVLWNSHPLKIATERRRESRHAYPCPIQLVPVDGSAETAEGSPIMVLGKYISNHGVDFYSSQPLPFRRAIARFAFASGPDVQLLMDLTWCRFCVHGWYENGGRFLQAVAAEGDD